MYGIFTRIYHILPYKNQPININVGKSTVRPMDDMEPFTEIWWP